MAAPFGEMADGSITLHHEEAYIDKLVGGREWAEMAEGDP